MPFPVSHSGAVEVPRIEVEEALRRLTAALQEVEGRGLRREGAGLRFRGGIFRAVSNLNVLVPISSGQVVVEATGSGTRASYRITFWETLVAASAMAAIIGVGTAREPDGLWLPAAAWAWLFGGNYLIALWRFRRFLRRAMGREAGAG